MQKSYIVQILIYSVLFILSMHQTTASPIIQESSADAGNEVTSRHLVARETKMAYSVGEPRQAALALATAIGAALWPLIASTFGNAISQFASTISSAVLGKLEEEKANNTAHPYYNGYLINNGDTVGPYLFLMSPNSGSNGNEDSERPSSADYHLPRLPTQQSNPNSGTLLYSPGDGTIIRKTATIKEHLGTINIIPNLATSVSNGSTGKEDVER